MLKHCLKTHDIQYIVKCTVCGEEFESSRLLDGHHTARHADVKRFRCGFCDASFSWAANLHRHERTHAADTHDCPHCNKGFLDARSLRVHVSSRHMTSSQDREKPFLCRLCGKCFRYDFSYDAHMNAHEIPPERRAAALVVLSNGRGKKVMKEYNIELISEPGQSARRSVSVDPYFFNERFVELPVCDNMGSEQGKEDDVSNRAVTEESELLDVGATQVFELVEEDVTDAHVDAILCELTADGKAVNMQNEVNPIENSREMEHERKPATQREHVADVCISITAVTTNMDDTTHENSSTGMRRKSRTKRRQCDLNTSEENTDTYGQNRKSLYRGTSST